MFAKTLVGTPFAVVLPAPLADLLAVDKRAVAAAEITNANVRRIDVEQAVAARDLAMVRIVGQARMAIRVAADDARAAIDEDVLTADVLALSDRKRNLSRHEDNIGEP